jgi:hypothetical protein
MGLCLFGIAVVSYSQDRIATRPNSQTTPSSSQAAQEGEQIAFLGVSVEPMFPALASHLPGGFAPGQGVLIADVDANSPAEKAGLKPHDVLLTYGDQKLFSPEQLGGLVAADKPGAAVKLSIFRQGKKDDVTVTLSSHARQPRQDFGTFPQGPLGGWMARLPRQFLRGMPQNQVRSGANPWESFDAMTLRKTGDNRFQIEIQYLDKDGKTQKHTFEGTREEIRRDIEAQRDLPGNERQHLLRALDLPGGFGAAAAPFFMPGWGFEQPDNAF